MRAKLAALAAGTLVVGLPLAVIAIDAAWAWRPSADHGVAARVAAAPDLDAFLTDREDSMPGVKPALRKAIRWHDPATRARTPIAVVYLHGFSASRGELAPVPEHLADSLGANLFVTRLAAHGRTDGEAFKTVRPQDWMDDAREARVAAPPRDANVDGSVTVDAAREDFVADGLVGRERLPRHRRDRKSTRLNSSHIPLSRMPSSA